MDHRKPDFEKQLDADIEELEKMQYGEPEQKQATPPEEPEIPEVQEGEEVDESVGTEEVQVQPGPEVAEVEAVEVEPEKPKRTSWKREFTELEKRYKKLRATHDSSMFQLRKQNTSLITEVEELQGQMDVLSEKLATISANEPSVDVSSMFSQEDRDILGETAIESFSKVAETMLENKLKPIKAEEERRKKREKKDREEQAEYNRRESNRIFKTRLAEIIPNFEEIDNDPQFMEYLNEVDPRSGQKRFHLFKKSQNIGDVGRVADFFEEYDTIKNSAQRQLERQITPTGQGTGTEAARTSQAGQPELIPFSEIDLFHTSITNGTYVGTRKDMEALDAKYDRAFEERRIDYTR